MLIRSGPVTVCKAVKMLVQVWCQTGSFYHCGAALQMAAAIFSYAFLLVIISTLAMIPVMLYIFNLRNLGWMWQDAGLFAAMVASTDAVAVGALLKKGELSETQLGCAANLSCTPPAAMDCWTVLWLRIATPV